MSLHLLREDEQAAVMKAILEMCEGSEATRRSIMITEMPKSGDWPGYVAITDKVNGDTKFLELQDDKPPKVATLPGELLRLVR